MSPQLLSDLLTALGQPGEQWHVHLIAEAPNSFYRGAYGHL